MGEGIEKKGGQEGSLLSASYVDHVCDMKTWASVEPLYGDVFALMVQMGDGSRLLLRKERCGRCVCSNRLDSRTLTFLI